MLGDKITEHLELRGWELADLARASGVDIKTLWAIVSRNSEHSRFAPQIAGALEISLEELYGVEAPTVRQPGVARYSDVEIAFLDNFRQLRERDQKELFAKVAEQAQEALEWEREITRKHGLAARPINIETARKNKPHSIAARLKKIKK